MKSVMVTSLPKSFSTPLYKIVRRSLPWYKTANRVARHGEIFSLLPDALETLYGHQDVEAVVSHFRQYSLGHLAKDVLAPGVMKHLVNDFHLLFMRRPVEDLLYLRIHRQAFKWELGLLPRELLFDFVPPSYKAISSADKPLVETMKQELADGLLWAHLELSSVAHQVVDFDDVTSQPEALWASLDALGLRPNKVNYINTKFVKLREERLKMRTTSEYEDLALLVERRRPVVQEVWNSRLQKQNDILSKVRE